MSNNTYKDNFNAEFESKNSQDALDALNHSVEDVLDEVVKATRTISSGITVPYNGRSLFYSKTKRISFPVKELFFKNIPVRQSVQLSFYEKYIVLLLQKGVYAIDTNDITSKVSNLLNVSDKCVQEFLSFLSTKGLIEYDPFKNIYTLDKSIRFSIDKSANNAMFADFGIKMADCNQIVYLDHILPLYLKEDFDESSFNIAANKQPYSESIVNKSNLRGVLNNKDNELRNLIQRCFSGTDMHIVPSFSYEFVEERINDYTISFDATIEYEYYPESQQSIRKNTVVMNSNILPDSFINKLSQDYNYDNDLPKFIKLDDILHKTISPNTKSVKKIIDEIDQAEISIEPIKKKLEENKNKLTDLKNTQKKNIELKQEELNEHINDEITKLKTEIKTDEDKIKEIKGNIDSYNHQKSAASTEYKDFVNKNSKELDSIIKNVLKKYPEEINIFNRYVSDICLWLNSAISASEFNSFDEVGHSIDMIREMYRKVLHAVFDVLQKKSAESLGYYLSDPFGLLEIEELFKKKKISPDIRSKLSNFHNLSNAIGHSIENGPQKINNAKKVEDFKQMNVKDREKILLAIPIFFNSITLTNTEVKAVVEKLKM